MKILFVVEGEGRGHFTQAISLKRMLEANGHQVTRVLVGKSPDRQLPPFFKDEFDGMIREFNNPNFLPSAHNKKVNIFRTISFNVWNSRRYFKSLRIIKKEINRSNADLVINFYELLTGLVYGFYRPKVKMIAIAHQYVFLHSKFRFPGSKLAEFESLNFFSRITSLNAKKRLALSFYPLPPDKFQAIEVVPPLIRKEVLEAEPRLGNYLHGYMLNSGFSEDIIAWHEQHPEVPLHFFWDKKDAPGTMRIDDTLSFHRLNDKLFIEYMAGCRGYATTAGFESVCEAMYLQKPVMLVPAHIEQECNAYEAKSVKAGVVSDEFDLSKLLEYIPEYQPNDSFRLWVKESEERILKVLDEVCKKK